MHKRAPDFKEFIQEFDNIDEGGGNSVQQFLENFYFECRVKNLSPKTISGYGERLQHFYKFLKSRKIPFEEITKSHIQSYILSMKDQVSDHTINGRIRILRLFFNYLQKEDFLNNGNPMNGVKLIRAEKKFPEVIGIKEIESLLSIANKRTFTGYRNYLMLLILWDSMIRLGELRYLKIDDIDIKSGVIRVFGKGRKERFIPLGTRTIKAIHHYLIKFRNQIKQRQVQQIFERLSEKSGIKVNPHKVRHSAATFVVMS